MVFLGFGGKRSFRRGEEKKEKEKTGQGKEKKKNFKTSFKKKKVPSPIEERKNMNQGGRDRTVIEYKMLLGEKLVLLAGGGRKKKKKKPEAKKRGAIN